MTPQEKLLAEIRESATIINEYETIQRLASDPKERARAAHTIAEQQILLRFKVATYLRVCRGTGEQVAPDILQIALMIDTESASPDIAAELAHVQGRPTPAAPSTPAFDPARVDRGTLRREMTKAYPQPDFELLCLDLGKRYDLLRGDNLQLKLAYLIEDAWDTPFYTTLVQKVIEDHPHLQERLL
jgi:hypothetical protein